MDYSYRMEKANDYDYPPVGGHPPDERMQTEQHDSDQVTKLREIIDLMGQRITALGMEKAVAQDQANTLAAEVVRLRETITALEQENEQAQYAPCEQGHGGWSGRAQTW